jgi:hypothetical protein
MNLLVLNEVERNMELDPSVHWVRGKVSNPDWFRPFLKQQLLTLHTLQLGSNLSVYGNTLQNINGLQTTQYVHIGEGNYQWSTPLVFISFHIEKMNT